MVSNVINVSRVKKRTTNKIFHLYLINENDKNAKNWYLAR